MCNERKFNVSISMDRYELELFLKDQVPYYIISDVYYNDILYDHEDKCDSCDEKCDEDFCQYVHNQESYKDEIAELKAQTDNSNAQEIVFEYMKLNNRLPVEIIKELDTDELTRILKEIGYEQPHICRCKPIKG